MQLGAGIGFEVGPVGLVALAALVGVGAFVAWELNETPDWSAQPGCCTRPRPVQQLIPPDLCRASFPAACCTPPTNVLG